MKSNKEEENSSKRRDIFPNKTNSEKMSKNEQVNPVRSKSKETQDSNDKATNQGNGRNISCSIDLVLLRLKNPPHKNLCFSNVVATCLLNIPVLRKFLQGKTTFFENQSAISAELSELARHLSADLKSTQRLRTIVMTKCLMSGQKNIHFNNNMQYDCVEFMQALFEHFWGEQSWNENLNEHVFGGLFQETLECECGKNQILPIEKIAEVLHLQVRGQTVQSCLDAFLSKQEIKSDCPQCDSTRRSKSIEILCMPTTIILHLLRFCYEEKIDETLKIMDTIFCPKQITLPNGSTFLLSSVINHIGEHSTSGHYNILIFDEAHDKFILMDDSEITDDVIIDDYMAQQSYVAT